MTRSVEGDGTSCFDGSFSVSSTELGDHAAPPWAFNAFQQAPGGEWTAALAIESGDEEASPTVYMWKGAPLASRFEVTPTSAKVSLTLEGPGAARVEVAGELSCPSYSSEPVPDSITALLARHAGTPVRAYSTHDFGRARYPGAASVIVRGDAETMLRRVRGDLPRGWVAYLGTSRFLGDEKVPQGSVELVVAPGAGPMDIVRTARTDAVNYNILTEGLVRALAAWDRAWGIDVLHAETDTIELTLTRMPDDLSAFAREVYALCPDVVDQGTGTVEALEKEIATRRRVYLWWD